MADIIRNEVIDAVLTRQTIREYKPIMLTDAQLDTLTAADDGSERAQLPALPCQIHMQ